MTTDELYKKGELSARSYNICKNNGVESIYDMATYYSENKTFLFLRSCGENSNIELIKLLEKYDKYKTKINIYEEIDDSQIKAINLYIRSESYKLSRRNLNALNRFFRGNLTFSAFLEKDIFSKNLSSIENVGKKSIPELSSYFHRVQNHIDSFVILDKLDSENTLSYKIKKANRLQRQVINRFIKYNIKNLKVRSRNAFISYIGESVKVFDLVRKIYDKKTFQISRIKNIGETSIPELESLLARIKIFITEVLEVRDENELIILNNSFLIKNTFSIKEIPTNILLSKSILKLCEFLIIENLLFKEEYNAIFINEIKIFNTNIFSKVQTSSESNLTRERVRQIKLKCFLDLPEKLSFLKWFDKGFYQDYEISENNNFIYISNEKCAEINKKNGTSFSRGFIIYTFSIYYSNSYNLIGNIEDILMPKSFSYKSKHKWKNVYLIKKDLTKYFDFVKMIEDVSSRNKERIKETYKFNFRSYLSVFLTEENYRTIDILKDYCETLINEEFSLFLDLEDNIVFERNTSKSTSEYTYEALCSLGKPSKIEEIYNKISELFPELNIDIEKVRTSLSRRRGFVPVGRRSIFGLKIWETQFKDFKGGTIRSMVKEFLEQFKEPKHISEITQYVLHYRPSTTEHNVFQNIKLDKTRMFKFYQNSHIGLSRKSYSDSFILATKNISWDTRYGNLKTFIELNNRLPYQNNCPKHEEVLCRWLYHQRSKINKGKINSKRAYLLTSLIEKFSNSPKRRRMKNSIQLNEVLEFIKRHDRLPKASINSEQQLYYYFYRKSILYKQNKLSSNEKNIVKGILDKFSK